MSDMASVSEYSETQMGYNNFKLARAHSTKVTLTISSKILVYNLVTFTAQSQKR